jgi:hypothetical protein
MNKENVVYTYKGVFFSHKEEWSYTGCRKIDGTDDHHVKQNKTDCEREILHVLSHLWNPNLFREGEIGGRGEKRAWWEVKIIKALLACVKIK